MSTCERTVLDELPLLTLLPADARTRAIERFVPIAFPFGSVIAAQGVAADGLYVLVAGRARIVRQPADGEEIALAVLRAGATRPSTVQRHVERAIGGTACGRLVRRLVFDTYEREVERYGGDAGADAAQRYFWVDSEAIIQLLDPRTGIGYDMRWQAAIPGIDRLLTDFGFDLPGKLRVMHTLRDRFGREFRADERLTRQLAASYRAFKPDLERLLRPNPSTASTGSIESTESPSWLAAFARRSASASEALTILRTADQAQQLEVPITVLAESYVHMHVNRLFRAEQRAHELVIYDFLTCLYAGHAARAAQPSKGDIDSP